MAIELQKLATLIGAELRGEGDRSVVGVSTIDRAEPDELTFLANPKYLGHLKDTRAGAVVLSAKDAAQAGDGMTLLIAEDPYFAFQRAMEELVGYRAKPRVHISPYAKVDPTARLGVGVTVGPFCVVEAGVVVGEGTVLHSSVTLMKDAKVGSGCELFPQVVIYNDCVLGDRVTLHGGCVIGQDGFGYATHPDEAGVIRHHKIPPAGNAVIEDDVEMGALCSVDRATIGSTRVKQGTKFSNAVTIGHGSVVGAHNLYVAQVGIAGSVTVGDYVAMGGQAGVAGHLTIGDYARVAAKAGVMRDIPSGQDHGGQPAGPFVEMKRQMLAVAKLPKALAELRRLKKKVAQLEQQLAERD